MNDKAAPEPDEIWDQLDETICITWISAGAEEAVGAFHGETVDLGRADRVSIADEFQEQFTEEPEEVFLLRQIGGWVIILEMRSCRGMSNDVLLAASRSGIAINLIWDVNMHAQLTYAVNSTIRYAFDPAEMGDRDRLLIDKEPLDDANHWSASLGITDADWFQNWKAAAFSLARAVTGVGTDDTWLRDVWTPIRLRAGIPRLGETVELPYQDMRELVVRAPEIRDIVEHPGPAQLSRMMRILVVLALSATGTSTPLTEAALAALDTRLPDVEMDSLARRLRQAAKEQEAKTNDVNWDNPSQFDMLHRKRKALLAAAAALKADPLTTFPEVLRLTGATGLRRDNDDYLTHEIMHVCYNHIVKKASRN